MADGTGGTEQFRRGWDALKGRQLFWVLFWSFHWSDRQKPVSPSTKPAGDSPDPVPPFTRRAAPPRLGWAEAAPFPIHVYRVSPRPAIIPEVELDDRTPCDSN